MWLKGCTGADHLHALQILGWQGHKCSSKSISDQNCPWSSVSPWLLLLGVLSTNRAAPGRRKGWEDFGLNQLVLCWSQKWLLCQSYLSPAEEAPWVLAAELGVEGLGALSEQRGAGGERGNAVLCVSSQQIGRNK